MAFLVVFDFLLETVQLVDRLLPFSGDRELPHSIAFVGVVVGQRVDTGLQRDLERLVSGELRLQILPPASPVGLVFRRLRLPRFPRGRIGLGCVLPRFSRSRAIGRRASPRAA